jgi:hypothetical protein
MSFLSRFVPKPQLSLEQQLENLATVGIRLNPQFSAETLLEEFTREKFEERPYVGAIITMGGYAKNGQPLSDNIFHLNTESIEGEGDYAHVAERMRDLAQGDLPIENIRDHLDFENGDAWVAFELTISPSQKAAEDGAAQTKSPETIEWHARVKEKWIDPEILSNFCALLKAQGAKRGYTYFDLKGKDCLIGCATEEQVLLLRKMTGMNFTWLE